MTRQTWGTVNVVLAVLLVVGAILRLVAWQISDPIHPDEFFQYLEPAWWRLTGVGAEAWEFRDGVRSWVLPIYNGSWMALLRAAGIQRGAVIGAALQVHWAMINLLLVLVAFRGGALVQRRVLGLHAEHPCHEGALLAALGCGLWPMLVKYSPHTLSEMPSMLCLVWGLVLTGEVLQRDRDRFFAVAAFAGGLISLGVCLRIANGPMALVAPLWILGRRRPKTLAALVTGALVPVLGFGLVDLVTWGKPWGSFVTYIKFNFIEGRAAEFGTEPWYHYVDRMFHRAPVGLVMLGGLLLLRLRATWPFALSALGLVAYLSTQAHKEERFVVAFWPFAIIGAAGVVGAWAGTWRWQPISLRWKVSLIAIVIMFSDALRNISKNDFGLSRGRLEAQAFVGKQSDVTTLVVDEGLFTGGSMWFGQQVPQIGYNQDLLENPLVSHLVLKKGSQEVKHARRLGFRKAFRSGEFVVYVRGSAGQGDR